MRVTAILQTCVSSFNVQNVRKIKHKFIEEKSIKAHQNFHLPLKYDSLFMKSKQKIRHPAVLLKIYPGPSPLPPKSPMFSCCQSNHNEAQPEPRSGIKLGFSQSQ